MKMEMLETRVCRLCFSTENQLIDIFDDFEANIPYVLTKHIGEVNCFKSFFVTLFNCVFFLIQVDRSDALPKYICNCCREKVVCFHEFHRNVHDAQENYLKKLVKVEDETDEQLTYLDIGIKQSTYDDNDVSTNQEVFSDFANGSPANLKTDEIHRNDLPLETTEFAEVFIDASGFENEKTDICDLKSGLNACPYWIV